MSVVGYSYQAENLCPSCTVKAMRASGLKVQRGKAHEDAIRAAAATLGVDFEDERSYDQSEFPKVVTEQMCETELTEVPGGETGVRHAISDEQCTGDKCGKWLVLGEKSPSEPGLARTIREAYELPRALAKLTAGTLREWGLSHPEFIDEDTVKEAAAQHPHAWLSWRFVLYPDSTKTVEVRTPEKENEACVLCGQPWEAHTFTCDTCGIDVSAIVPHTHQSQVKVQLKIRKVKGE